MPVHYCVPELNIASISSPLGTQIPHASGAGYGFRLSKEDRVAVAYFGDGSASEGDFHTALNFAATLKC
jgi:2-oxoisovalerate dehydrogenase E1 component alpha subunit